MLHAPWFGQAWFAPAWWGGRKVSRGRGRVKHWWEPDDELFDIGFFVFDLFSDETVDDPVEVEDEEFVSSIAMYALDILED